VNPTDIDSRYDVIVKHVELESAGTTQSLTFRSCPKTPCLFEVW
jgi:hypothetical protein